MPDQKRLTPYISRRSGRITARDVAEQAGVSASTVSRVLSGVPTDMISEATRQRVIEAAAQLGYSPDPIARALRGKKSYLLGLIVREIDDPFFARFTAELSRQARALGYHIVLGYAQSDPQEALQMSNVLDTRHTDGVFILGDLKNDEVALAQMVHGAHPVVALCRGPSPASLFTFNTDNEAGARMLLDHLVGLGHRRIAFIDGGWLGDIRERREAYDAYMQEKGFERAPEWIQADTNSPAGGYRAMTRLLALNRPPTAVFAADDLMAFGALKAVVDAGLRVPDDLSVVGFDDIELSEYFCPSLTTVRQPIEAMSQQALRLMLDLINEADTRSTEAVVRIQPELVIRQSTGPAKSG